MVKPPQRKMHPRDFEVNRTWLAFRINQVPLRAEGREIDLYVLQDAASMFLFGNAFSQHGAECPEPEDVERLMASAHDRRNAWPTELILAGKPASDNSFSKVAKRQGITVRSVPESQMSFYIKDVQESYEEHLARPDSDA